MGRSISSTRVGSPLERSSCKGVEKVIKAVRRALNLMILMFGRQEPYAAERYGYAIRYAIRYAAVYTAKFGKAEETDISSSHCNLSFIIPL